MEGCTGFAGQRGPVETIRKDGDRSWLGRRRKGIIQGDEMRRRHIGALALVAAALAFSCGDNGTDPGIEPETPPAPQWSHVASTSATGNLLQWTGVSGNAGYFIYRSAGSPNQMAPIDTTRANAEEYFDPAVEAGTAYYYRIRTRDSIGRLSVEAESPLLWCDAVDNRSPLVPSSPSPEDRKVFLEPFDDLTLRWNASDPDGDAFTRTIYFGESRKGLEQAIVSQDASADSQVVDRTLGLSRFFFWRVKLVDIHGATTYSPIWSFGTLIERLDIPAGNFVRGDSGVFHPRDPERFHWWANPVFVGAFNMDKYEVTNQLYAQFLNELFEDNWIRVTKGEVRSKVGDTLFIRVFPDGSDNAGIAHEAVSGFLPREGRENHPVVEVTWHGAQRFAKHYGRRLPTEAEWEKAARGTSGSLGWYRFETDSIPDSVGLGFPYPWGTTASSNRFNYAGSADPFESSVGIATTPVGYFSGATQGGYVTASNGSPYGIFDLAGNAAEWCSDDFVPYQGGPYGKMKVIKGGGWRSPAQWCQTYWRQEFAPDSTDNLVGFRTVAP